MADWLRGLLAAVVLAGIPFTASAGDIRVGFINPSAPPQFWGLVNTTMRVAATELGIDVDIRETGHYHDNAIVLAKTFLGRSPPLDYLIATNDLNPGGADAAHVNMIFLNNDLEQKDWAEYGEPRTKYRNWLGSIVPYHEGAGYGIATAILTEAARIKTNRPLKVLALTGDAETPAGIERVRGLKRGIEMMTKLLGPSSVELVDVRYLDWSAKMAEASVRQFLDTGPRIDALWATTRDLGDCVEVRVRDNGTGIRPDHREKLLQPFFTTKPTGEGTGLGLLISYDIVTQQHGGTIAFDSEPGAFTEFTVRLPRHGRTMTTGSGAGR